MRRTLYIKFIVGYLLFGLFGFLIVASFVSNMTSDQVRREAGENLYRQATQIANTYAADLYNTEISLDSAGRQLRAIASYTGTEIWILNPSGRLVVSTARNISPDEEVFIENFSPNLSGGALYQEGTFFGAFDEPHLSVLAPISSNFRIRGYVAIHLPMSQIRTRSDRYMNISWLLLLILLLLSLIILIFFTELVYIPLKKIIRATEQYASGNMHYQFSVDSSDEMGYLAATLGYMANEIAGAEDDQKKFIANVSHDFRSPLTSIRGFLTAMLDGTIPAEMHEKYLQIVLNETDRLTKLTNSLLTLNNLNTRGMLLARTDFDINGTIRSVGASFEQTCRAKGITLELVLLGEQLYVNADKERIEQVLYNLIDNALKFSPRGSAVRIETTERHSKIFVSVRDNGIGIPKNDQKLIFDRFYKTDLSRGKDKKGTGLGLSIVREILRAHDENINVISTEGVGSEFIFSLRRSDLNDELDD